MKEALNVIAQRNQAEGRRNAGRAMEKARAIMERNRVPNIAGKKRQTKVGAGTPKRR